MLFLYLFKIFNVNLIPSLPLSLGANLNQLEISLILEEIPDTSFIIKSNFSSIVGIMKSRYNVIIIS